MCAAVPPDEERHPDRAVGGTSHLRSTLTHRRRSVAFVTSKVIATAPHGVDHPSPMSRPFCFLVVSSALACVSPSHHVRRMGDRRAPRAETCTPESLPIHTDHGPDLPREAFAVVTAECAESKEPECRQHLLLGGCEAQADALVDVTSRVARGRRLMVGTAVEYVSNSTPPRSSGGAVTR